MHHSNHMMGLEPHSSSKYSPSPQQGRQDPRNMLSNSSRWLYRTSSLALPQV